MIQNIRVGIPIIGTSEWYGAVSYVEMLVKAISILPKNKRPQLTIVVTDGMLKAFNLHRSIIQFADSVIFVGQSISDAKKTIEQRFISLASFIELPRKIDFYYPVLAGVVPNFCSASWIPDFQHIHLPQYFSDQEIEARSSAFKKIADNARILTLNSKDAKMDFESLYPHSLAAIRILSFHPLHDNKWYQTDPVSIQKKYNLPDSFLICCNQFWEHKNHIRLFEAIAQLRNVCKDIHLVCTGETEDFRSKGYFKEVQKAIYALGVGDLVHILGHIPRSEQIQLIRRALAVVQPSLFEGAGLVAEESRALGKTIILSDIARHFEQSPDGCVYFDRKSSGDLAQTIIRLLPTLTPGPDSSREDQARNMSYVLAEKLAHQFCSLAVEAQFMFGRQIRNIDDKLWQLLTEPVSIDSFISKPIR